MPNCIHVGLDRMGTPIHDGYEIANIFTKECGTVSVVDGCLVIEFTSGKVVPAKGYIMNHKDNIEVKKADDKCIDRCHTCCDAGC